MRQGYFHRGNVGLILLLVQTIVTSHAQYDTPGAQPPAHMPIRVYGDANIHKRDEALRQGYEVQAHETSTLSSALSTSSRSPAYDEPRDNSAYDSAPSFSPSFTRVTSKHDELKGTENVNAKEITPPPVRSAGAAITGYETGTGIFQNSPYEVASSSVLPTESSAKSMTLKTTVATATSALQTTGSDAAPETQSYNAAAAFSSAEPISSFPSVAITDAAYKSAEAAAASLLADNSTTVSVRQAPIAETTAAAGTHSTADYDNAATLASTASSSDGAAAYWSFSSSAPLQRESSSAAKIVTQTVTVISAMAEASREGSTQPGTAAKAETSSAQATQPPQNDYNGDALTAADAKAPAVQQPKATSFKPVVTEDVSVTRKTTDDGYNTDAPSSMQSFSSSGPSEAASMASAAKELQGSREGYEGASTKASFTSTFSSDASTNYELSHAPVAINNLIAETTAVPAKANIEMSQAFNTEMSSSTYGPISQKAASQASNTPSKSSASPTTSAILVLETAEAIEATTLSSSSVVNEESAQPAKQSEPYEKVKTNITSTASTEASGITPASSIVVSSPDYESSANVALISTSAAPTAASSEGSTYASIDSTATVTALRTAITEMVKNGWNIVQATVYDSSVTETTPVNFTITTSAAPSIEETPIISTTAQSIDPSQAVGYDGIPSQQIQAQQQQQIQQEQQHDLSVSQVDGKELTSKLPIKRIDSSTKNKRKWKPFHLDCALEVDDRGEQLCGEWARGGLCLSHRATMFLFCRRTCLCVGPPDTDDDEKDSTEKTAAVSVSRQSAATPSHTVDTVLNAAVDLMEKSNKNGSNAVEKLRTAPPMTTKKMLTTSKEPATATIIQPATITATNAAQTSSSKASNAADKSEMARKMRRRIRHTNRLDRLRLRARI